MNNARYLSDQQFYNNPVNRGSALFQSTFTTVNPVDRGLVIPVARAKTTYPGTQRPFNPNVPQYRAPGKPFTNNF